MKGCVQQNQLCATDRCFLWGFVRSNLIKPCSVLNISLLGSYFWVTFCFEVTYTFGKNAAWLTWLLLGDPLAPYGDPTRPPPFKRFSMCFCLEGVWADLERCTEAVKFCFSFSGLLWRKMNKKYEHHAVKRFQFTFWLIGLFTVKQNGD